MGRDRKNEKRTEQWTKWIKYERDLEAWKALTFPARDAYFHFRVLCFAETANSRKSNKIQNNNGHIYLSSRDLSKLMGCSSKTATAAVADLQAKGWLICTKPHELGTEGYGKAPHFRLTMMIEGKGKNEKPPTKEPVHWCEGKDYHVIAYPKSKPKSRSKRVNNFTIRKQKPTTE